ncbi:MAG: secretin N-terminal domain-containing protein, partial [Planctomycetota bacterium]|nr:secretin N-terminal domain-containing protein [Planctomycetota bacterium]
MRQATKFLCIAASCAGLLANYAGGQSRPSAPSITVAPKAGATQPSSAPADSKEISASFKDMSVEKIGTFLSEKLKKPVLITDDIKAKKITIICKKKIPLAEAISLIRQALLAQEIMVEELPSLIRIRPVGEVMQAHLVRVPADRSVATIEDTIQIVAKEFFIRHYDVQKMVDVLKPMQPSFGHIMADPDTRKLVVTDTVANLIRIEQIIAGMDVPMAERTLTEIIKVEHGDASEIVAIVRWLIAGRMGIHVKGITTATGEPTKKTKTSSSSNRPGVSSKGPSRGRPSSIPPSRGKDSEGGKVEIGVTQIKPSEAIVTLVPHVSRNWIIAVAPAEIMVQIKIWVKQLDKPREVEKDYELYDVKYADINDVARQIEQAIQSLPSTELRDTTHVVPFGQSKKLIVFGSKTGRKMVRDLLSRLDVEDAEKRTRRTFILKHADAEEMAERIENLFSAMHVDYKYDYGGWYGGSSTRYRRDPNAPQVTIVPDKRRNAITVITDSETMLEIEELIRQEDTPVDPDEVKPKVYELKYIDAGEMRDLLSEMFSESESGRRSFWDYYFSPQRRESKPVGRLLGQFTFQVLPSSSKLIVNSKSIANYEVIDKLIEELDRPQRAGVPEFVELKFANAEDLCEQLNALLAEPGTLARIRRADRGLAERQKPDSEQSKSKSSGSSPDAGKPAEPGEMAFWWQGFRRPQGQVPTSNLIGKIRIVPVYRRNALMVLAPEG